MHAVGALMYGTGVPFSDLPMPVISAGMEVLAPPRSWAFLEMVGIRESTEPAGADGTSAPG